ncbi:hypothetical protein LTR37_005423 [Vermiconidia calcicola]|uniref:Uncharacterized protein n=1 Tax=Vermiconidia calcicola TaxID=1690605 RepID=A0ACC3NJI1_9PEZI|nr:hypothetical protein LTR37_005423 [Vermiconidia calcicola]
MIIPPSLHRHLRHRIAPRILHHGHNRSLSSHSPFFKISPEVQQALSENRPIVALESTIYTHGFPHPQNLSLASSLETLIRTHGGVPATIGILDGIARVGLSSPELERLVSAPHPLKISRRDFGFALGRGSRRNGGTTISATMILAHLAGIKVFATGGLGGVHRGAESTWDVSADLTELGRTPVAVISSGCKAFLDLPRTLEFLETQGVGVATFANGRDSNAASGVDFPAFWTRESGVPSPKVVRDEVEAAEVIYAHFGLGLQSGLFFANPIPEEHSLPKEDMDAAIDEALRHADAAGAVGAAATPYILDKIKEVTGSRSLEANRALVEANVVRGTKVALELVRLESEGRGSDKDAKSDEHTVVGPGAINYTANGVSRGVAQAPEPFATAEKLTTPFPESRPPNVFVAGSLALDLACDYAVQLGRATGDAITIKAALYTSNPARITQSLGGVGSNVARAAHLMGADVRLCSAIGDDLSGKAALEALGAAGMSTEGIKTLPSERTAQYVAVNDSSKDLLLAMADMSILETAETTISDALDDFWLPQLRKAKPANLVLDANWPPKQLAKWLEAGREINAHITYEPVSNAKSTALFRLRDPNTLRVFPTPSIHLATPNAHELTAMYTHARENSFFDRQDWWSVIDALGIPQSGARTQMALATSSSLVDQGIPQQSIQLLPFIPSICTKLGPQGVLLTQLIPANDERLTSGEYAPHILSRCKNETEGSVGVGGVYMRLFPAVEEVKGEDVVSVNGVGDTFAGTLVAGLAKGARVEELVDVAQRAAVLTLKSRESVSGGLGTLSMLI